MVVDNKFNFGDIVYLITDPDQFPRIITGMYVRNDSILYELSFVGITTEHYDIEMSYEKTIR